ncbi:hypothetical protein Tco_1055070 [Tanacetum coccineum]|uniref:Reverse transcriptase domain-containing protein n=1 Tax=Tanacetum coccineum TaxID=301880 RepID=A0ABQ5GYL1_9ASTR
MIPVATPLVGFSGEIIWPLGHISLLVKIGDEEHSTSTWMDFMVRQNGHAAEQQNNSTRMHDGLRAESAVAPEHRLNICEGCLPVRQKKRGQAPKRNKEIYEEVENLVNAGIMREVHYHNWLSNPVMAKKHDGIWRMCVDFKDLSKACPKDCYPLPEIDWKVESLCGYPFKCFPDAYKGYHQTKMAKEDEDKFFPPGGKPSL